MRALFSAALASLAAAQSGSAEQIHLALTGNPDEMHVSYAYQGGCPSSSSVNYGPTTGMGITATASMTTDSLSGDCWLDATMTGLKPNVQYYYSIDGGNTISFTNQPVREGGKIYAVLADFGMANDIAIQQLTLEAATNQFDAVIHAGDYAYDLETNYGANGDNFMNAIQNVSSTRPYMGAPGNHESDEDTFAQYLGRFNGFVPAAKNSGSDSLLWYSFNDGLVHFVSVDTELWYYGGSQQQLTDMYNWLAADLAAVDRSKTPWIVAFGHKQGYMDKQDFAPIETILQQYNVDLYFCGHQHNYQRLVPFNGVTNTTYSDCVTNGGNTYYNCGAMASFVVGSPGCKEGLSQIMADSSMLVNSAVAYGYGHLQVINATHAVWGWEELQSGSDDVGTTFADYVTIINTNHVTTSA